MARTIKINDPSGVYKPWLFNLVRLLKPTAMLTRRLRKGACLLLFGVVASIWILHNFNASVSIQLLPVHQTLLLDLNLPKSVTDRDFIVKHYIRNLQSQLEDKAVHYKEEDEKVYIRRKEYVNNFCQNRAENKNVDPKFIRSLTWYLDNPKIMYCSAAKSGSTFWRRAFEVMRRKDPTIVSPFQLSYLDFKESNARIPINYTKPEHRKEMSKLLQSTLKFVFAREPYHRVFSTYIDKILSPNSYMWGLGKNAVMKFRSNATKSCGADVTFGEFVKYINTQDSKTYDQHIRPIAYICDACDIQYDVIGKMETFQVDTRYILKKAKSYGREIVFKDMSTEYKVDHIVDNVIRAFASKGGWNKCISTHAGYQRLWRQLQIGGMIDKTDKYPFTLEQSNNITVTEYLNMALSAFKRSSPYAKANKVEAFLQAYSMVSLADMENLREHYIADFEMFDYEQRPEELFKSRKQLEGDFDYFDVMRLE